MDYNDKSPSYYLRRVLHDFFVNYILAGKLDGSQIPIHVQAIPGVTEVLSDSDDTTSGDTATHGNMRNNFGGRNSGGRTGRRGR